MELKKLGEFGLISRIAKKYPKAHRVIAGIGDDAAVLAFTKDKYLLFSTDIVIDGVHFTRRQAAFVQIGHKALACGLSDIAAMGGLPRYYAVSLGLPERIRVEDVDEIYRGMKRLARRFGISLVGGDTSSSDKLVIDVAVIGEVEKKNCVLRSGARAGDFIYVTGPLGGSRAGRHLNFTPRVKEARYLVRNFKIHAMIDISDGLSNDLLHITEASGTGAALYEELIPLSRQAKNIQSALCDGEDFELLFTAPKNPKRGQTPFGVFYMIGEVLPKECGVNLIKRNGAVVPVRAKGWKHF